MNFKELNEKYNDLRAKKDCLLREIEHNNSLLTESIVYPNNKVRLYVNSQKADRGFDRDSVDFGYDLLKEMVLQKNAPLNIELSSIENQIKKIEREKIEKTIIKNIDNIKPSVDAVNKPTICDYIISIFNRKTK